MNRLLIRGARQVLTLRGPSSPRRGSETLDLAVVEDGAILAENGIVLEVGPSRRIENLVTAKAARTIDAAGRIVMPGFVDASTNLIAAARGLTRNPTRLRVLAELDRYHGWFAEQGITSVAARYSSAKELTLLRTLRGRSPAVAEIFSGGDADSLLHSGGAAQVEVFCETDGLDVTRQLLFSTARRVGAGVRAYGPGACDAGLRGDAHLIENPALRNRSALDALGASATMVLLTPISVDRSLARPLLDSGSALALATGFGPALPRTASASFLISWAVLEMSMTVEEAITSVTVNAAHALGLARTIGTLESGKAADFVVFDCQDYRDVATHPGINLISMVVKNGQVVYREPAWTP